MPLLFQFPLSIEKITAKQKNWKLLSPQTLEFKSQCPDLSINLGQKNGTLEYSYKNICSCPKIMCRQRPKMT